MSDAHSAERQWALRWQSGLERQSPPQVHELQELIRTLPGIRPEVAEHVLDLLVWVPPSRAVVILAAHNGCRERAAVAYNAAYDRLVEQVRGAGEDAPSA